MSTHLELREQILNELKKIVMETFSETDVRIYLFGSWAREEEKQSSDIDIAIEDLNPICTKKWVELNERIEESTIPYHVDIVDMETASSSLANNIKMEGIVWNGCKNG